MQSAQNSTADQGLKWAQMADTSQQSQLRRLQMQMEQQKLNLIPGLLAGNPRPSGPTSLVAPPTAPAATLSGSQSPSASVANPAAPPSLIASDPGYNNPTSAEQAVLSNITGNENGSGNPALVHYSNGGDATDLADVRSRTVTNNSHAFGDYGFQPDTYSMAANGVGFDPNDISKPNQDRAALYMLRNYGPNASISWRASGVAKGKPYANPYAANTSTAASPQEYYLGTMTADDSAGPSGQPPAGGSTGYAGVQGQQGSPSGPSAPRPTPSMNGGMGINPTGTAGVQGLMGSPSGPTDTNRATTLPDVQVQATPLPGRKPTPPAGVTQYAPASIQSLGPAAVAQWTQQMRGLGYNVGDPAAGNTPPGVSSIVGAGNGILPAAAGQQTASNLNQQQLTGLLASAAPAIAKVASAVLPQIAQAAQAGSGGSTPPAQAPSSAGTSGGQPPPPNSVAAQRPDLAAANAAANAAATAGPGSTGGLLNPQTGTVAQAAPQASPTPLTPQPPQAAGPSGQPASPQGAMPYTPADLAWANAEQNRVAGAKVLGIDLPLNPQAKQILEYDMAVKQKQAEINAQAQADITKAGPIATAQQGARVGPESQINANKQLDQAQRAYDQSMAAQITVPQQQADGSYKEVTMPYGAYLDASGQPRPPRPSASTLTGTTGGTPTAPNPNSPTYGQPLQPSSSVSNPSGQPPSPPPAAAGSSATGAFGKPIANAQSEYNMKVYQPVIESDNKRIAESLVPMADKANETLQTASLIHDLMGRVSTGWGADELQTAAQILSRMGADPKGIQKLTGMDPAAGDAIRKLFLAQSSAAVRTMGAREPGSVIQLFGRAYPSLETQPDAIKLMENVFTMQAQRDQDHLAAAQNYQNDQLTNVRNGQPYSPLSNFETKFNSASSPSAAVNYVKAAQVMTNGISALNGVSDAQRGAIWSLLPPDVKQNLANQHGGG